MSLQGAIDSAKATPWEWTNRDVRALQMPDGPRSPGVLTLSCGHRQLVGPRPRNADYLAEEIAEAAMCPDQREVLVDCKRCWRDVVKRAQKDVVGPQD